MTDRQKEIVKIIHDFNEGWLHEEALEEQLEAVFKNKNNGKRKEI